jgi:hypothetical protein
LPAFAPANDPLKRGIRTAIVLVVHDVDKAAAMPPAAFMGQRIARNDRAIGAVRPLSLVSSYAIVLRKHRLLGVEGCDSILKAERNRLLPGEQTRH